jgi:hypothetical protein
VSFPVDGCRSGDELVRPRCEHAEAGKTEEDTHIAIPRTLSAEKNLIVQ